MYIDFSREYKLALLKYLEDELLSLPDVRFGRHNNETVVRIFKKSSKYSELKMDKCDKNIIDICNQRLAIKKKIKLLCKDVSKTSVKIQNTGIHQISRSTWDKIKPGMNTISTESKYVHKGIHMRSRLELIVAQTLDNLELEYKYEPVINSGVFTFSPDFMVYLPAFETCIIIECLGMIDDDRYLLKNIGKIGEYLSSNFKLGRDLLIIHGYSNSIQSPEEIHNDIVSAINKIAAECVF